MTQEERTAAYAGSLARLIRAETVSAPGNSGDRKFMDFHTLLQETFPHFFAAVRTEEFRGSFLLRWPGRDGAAKPVMLMSHHDVVEAPGEWEHPPFSGDISGGKLWGRGTLDTKGNLWAMLQAAEELVSDGFSPARDVYFESACNEETDGAGAQKIASVLEERGIRFAMTLDEGGMIVHDPVGGADGTFAMVGVGEKGCADLKFTARSAGGHASTPGKDTPLVRLGPFMAAADRSKLFRAEMSPVVREMFSRLAPTMTGGMKLLCGNLQFFGGLMTKVMPSVSPAASALLRTTLAFTMAQGSAGTNVLPQEAWVIGNLRFSHHQGGPESIAAVRRLAAKYGVETEVLEPGFSSPVADFRGKPFHLAERAVAAVFPGVNAAPYVMNGASDSRFFGRVCGDCLRFAPFQVNEQQIGSIHGLNENVDLCSLAPAVDFFKYILREV